MNRKVLFILTFVLLLGAFLTFAQGPNLLSYQGKLVDSNGIPLASGNYNITFNLYDAQSGGNKIFTETLNVAVTGGYFNAILGETASLSPYNFSDNAEVWLEVVATINTVDETFSRTRLVSAPSAMTLVPGAAINRDAPNMFNLLVKNGSAGGYFTPKKRAIWAQTDTGNAIQGNADSGYGVLGASNSGTGVYGSSSSGYGVYGHSLTNWSGYFTNGIRITDSDSNGIDINNAAGAGVWVQSSTMDGFQVNNAGRHGFHVINAASHGVYVENPGGNGIYVKSGGGGGASQAAIYAVNTANNTATAIWGSGAYGIVGTSVFPTTNYAGYFYQNVYVGGKINLVGTVDPIIGERFQIDPSSTFEPGDVLVIDAESEFVKLSTKANDTKVIGVVDQDVDIKNGEIMLTIMGFHGAEPEPGPDGETDNLPERSTAKVKADAGYGAIKRGDLLTSSNTPGYAMKAQPVDVGGVEIYRSGTIIGKAMESLDSGKGLIEVFVALQ